MTITQIANQATQGPPAPRGLTVRVVRPVDFPDCTNGGVSARVAQLTIVGIIDETKHDTNSRGQATVEPMPEDSRVSGATPAAPAAYLRLRRFGRQVVCSVEPAYPGRKTQPWLMAGGNYAASSDSRWAALTGMYGAVSIHDRNEEGS